MSKPKKVLFLDTNILLHFTLFTDIDWPHITGASEVKLVIAPIIMRELERRKYNERDQSLKDRAGRISARLFGLFRSHEQVRPRTQILFEAQEPDQEFASYRLSRETQDDHLLASILLYKNQHPEEDVVLVTNDLPLHIKAAPLSIKTQELPNEYRIPYEADPNLKKIRELENEIRELTNRTPRPELLFDNGLNRLTFTVPREAPPKTSSEMMEEIKREYPRMEEPPVKAVHPPPTPADPNTVVIHASDYPTNTPRRSDIKKYNESLEAFYEEYEEYLYKLQKSNELNTRKFEVRIRLVNSGTAPVERVVVFMTIPKVVRLSRTDTEFTPPRAPSPPERPKAPKSLFESMKSWREPYRPPIFIPSPPRLSQYVERPNIERNGFNENESSYQVSFTIRQAIHNLVYECPYQLFAVFESLETAKSFRIEWQIVAANIPQPVDGSLHVIVENGTGD